MNYIKHLKVTGSIKIGIKLISLDFRILFSCKIILIQFYAIQLCTCTFNMLILNSFIVSLLIPHIVLLLSCILDLSLHLKSNAKIED